MRRKSDEQKKKEGRCLGKGKDYVGQEKANESGSIGTSCMICDPIEGRVVDVLSMGEKEFYFLTRFRDDVKSIQEQMKMDDLVILRSICFDYGFCIPRNTISTDFLITYNDQHQEAFSIKAKRSEFDANLPKYQHNPAAYQRLLIRQFIEKEYWNRQDINRFAPVNIQNCLAYYNQSSVSDVESMLKYLIAHKFIKVKMSEGYINFSKIATLYEDEIVQKYMEVTRHGETK